MIRRGSATKGVPTKRSIRDRYDSFMEDVNIIFQDQAVCQLASYGICILLNFVLFVSVFSRPTTIYVPNKANPHTNPPFVSDVLSELFNYVLLGVSIVNMIIFLHGRKTYHLLRCEQSEMGRSPNMKQIMISVPEDANTESAVEVAEMKIWNPAILNQTVFVFFSPLQVFAEIFIYNNILLQFMLACGTIGMLYIMIEIYDQKIVDTQILGNQAYAELNHFAVSRMSVRKEDKSTQCGRYFSEMDTGFRYTANPAPAPTYFTPQPVKKKSNPFQKGSPY